MTIPRLERVEARPGCRLYMEFDDGVRGEIDLTADLTGPVLAPLRDPKVFAQVRLDELGAPSWPNGADLAPDALHRDLEAAQQGR